MILRPMTDALRSLFPLPGAHTCAPPPPKPESDEFFPADDAHTARCTGWAGMRQRFEDGEIRCFDCGETTGVMS